MSEDNTESKSVIFRKTLQQKGLDKDFDTLKSECMTEEEVKPLMDRVGKLCKEAEALSQEKIFKFLWPDKHWHKVHLIDVNHSSGTPYCLTCDVKYAKCPWNRIRERITNPDLTTPSGTVMILDRLVEMGYRIELGGRETGFSYCPNYNAEIYKSTESLVVAWADTAPLAVLHAVQALMEKEEGR